MEKVEKFWQWFVDHNEELVAMGDLEDKEREQLENALQYQLRKYLLGDIQGCSGLHEVSLCIPLQGLQPLQESGTVYQEQL